jgi:uncharacterized membrane protein
VRKSRIEAFSDGVIAILITIMVLELRTPADASIESLAALAPLFVSYVLSFTFLGIYWNNHHHMFQAIERVDGRALWANLHLLFWLSLVPFVTGWVGEREFAPVPIAVDGVVLLLAAMAYFLLTRALVSLHGSDLALGVAVGSDVEGKVSLLLYALAVPLAFVQTAGGLRRLCPGGPDLAGAGPADREGAGRAALRSSA